MPSNQTLPLLRATGRLCIELTNEPVKRNSPFTFKVNKLLLYNKACSALLIIQLIPQLYSYKTDGQNQGTNGCFSF